MLDANKTDFITLILDQLNEHSVRDSAMLYESPFTDRISRGPDGLFSSAQADQLLTAIAP